MFAQKTGVVQLVITGAVEDVLVHPVPGQLGGLGGDADLVVLVLVSLALHHIYLLVGSRSNSPARIQLK